MKVFGNLPELQNKKNTVIKYFYHLNASTFFNSIYAKDQFRFIGG
jgi:hypothetical protein